MNKRQKFIVDKTAQYYLDIDNIRLEAKNKVDDFMISYADYISDNWDKFAKSPKAVTKGFILSWIKKNKELLNKTAEITDKFAQEIL